MSKKNLYKEILSSSRKVTDIIKSKRFDYLNNVVRNKKVVHFADDNKTEKKQNTLGRKETDDKKTKENLESVRKKLGLQKKETKEDFYDDKQKEIEEQIEKRKKELEELQIKKQIELEELQFKKQKELEELRYKKQKEDEMKKQQEYEQAKNKTTEGV